MLHGIYVLDAAAKFLLLASFKGGGVYSGKSILGLVALFLGRIKHETDRAILN